MHFLLALGAISFWSTNATVASIILQKLPVEQVQFLQFLGAFCVLAVVKVFQENERRWQVSTEAAVLGSIGLTGTMIFQYFAFYFGPIVHVNIIAYAWPVLTVLMILGSGTTSHPKRLMGLAVLGFLGASLVVSDGSQQSAQDNFSVWGILTAIGSATCMAFYSFAVGRRSVNATECLTAGALLGVIATGIWCWLGSSHWANIQDVLVGLYLGIGPMGVGYLLWSSALKKDRLGNVPILGFLTPITSTGLLLAMGAGASINFRGIIGACIVIATCALVGWHSWLSSRG